MNLRDRIPDGCFFACPDNKYRQLQEELDIAQTDVTKAREAGLSAQGCDILQGHVQALSQTAERLIKKIPEKADGPWHANYAAAGLPGTVPLEVPHCCRFAGVVVIGKGKTVEIDRPQ